MVDPVQAAIGIIVVLIAVGGLLYLFYSRTNAVEKTGYGALIMLSIVSLMIPVFWITESNGQAIAKIQQHTTDVQRGASLYAQYCFQCHGINGQGQSGPKLNGNPAVNNLTNSVARSPRHKFNTCLNSFDRQIQLTWARMGIRMVTALMVLVRFQVYYKTLTLLPIKPL